MNKYFKTILTSLLNPKQVLPLEVATIMEKKNC